MNERSQKLEEFKKLILESMKKENIRLSFGSARGTVQFCIEGKKTVVLISFSNEKTYYPESALKRLSWYNSGPEEIRFGFDTSMSFSSDRTYDVVLNRKELGSFGRELFNTMVDRVREQAQEKENGKLDVALAKYSGFDEL